MKGTEKRSLQNSNSICRLLAVQIALQTLWKVLSATFRTSMWTRTEKCVAIKTTEKK